MEKENSNSIYVDMMVNALRHKCSILKYLLQLTEKQRDLLRDEEMDPEVFTEIVEDKGSQIDELNEIDEGFDVMFQRVKSEVVSHREDYRSQIEEMQELIAEISDIGVSIQALEHQNSERFKAYLARERQEIKEFHVNNRTASTYYQNMTNMHRDNQSYFLNEKK